MHQQHSACTAGRTSILTPLHPTPPNIYAFGIHLFYILHTKRLDESECESRLDESECKCVLLNGFAESIAFSVCVCVGGGGGGGGDLLFIIIFII